MIDLNGRVKGVLRAVAAGALILGVSGGAMAAIVDFESLSHGRVVDDEFAGSGLTISADNTGGGPDLAVIFDSRFRRTADSDLEGPNGFDSVEWDGGNLPSDAVLGNLLIIQERGFDDDGFISSRPDDEGTRPAGSLRFDFGFALRSFGFDLVDVEGPVEFGTDDGFIARFFMGGSEVGNIGFAQFLTDDGNPFFDSSISFGDNTANRIGPVTAEQIGGAFDSVVLQFGGSGGVANVNYFRAIPAPPALAGGLILMGMMTAVRRGRKRPHGMGPLGLSHERAEYERDSYTL